ncbi:hypothetical protein Pmani_027046 [Petrolisthes manimaculis]|uniref:Uncharacterized protein n=1 Tax=Petrolisthes manimaculis TaxID=1843537 RepID=A0AAE1P4Z4_9EUCA|nr:hypothetical protein Pmani_027046 [Petrolisthes manimaculis]
MSVDGSEARRMGGWVGVSFDARGSTVENGKHWEDKHLLERRAYFQLLPGNSWGGSSAPGAHLELFPVQDRDEATYRCRVDFLLSPTKNTIVNFTVITLSGIQELALKQSNNKQAITGSNSFPDGQLGGGIGLFSGSQIRNWYQIKVVMRRRGLGKDGGGQ